MAYGVALRKISEAEMTKKEGVIEDVRYEADSKACVVHVDCGDGVHTATLPADIVEKHGYHKGMKVVAEVDSKGNAVTLLP